MPLYDFKCGECTHIWEDIVGLNAESPLCPSCSAPASRKLIGTGMAFHGVSPTDPIVDEHSGLVIETNAQMRAWEAANPNTRLIARGSRDEGKLRKMLEAHDERNAAKYGFTSAHQRQHFTRSEIKKRRAG